MADFASVVSVEPTRHYRFSLQLSQDAALAAQATEARTRYDPAWGLLATTYRALDEARTHTVRPRTHALGVPAYGGLSRPDVRQVRFLTTPTPPGHLLHSHTALVVSHLTSRDETSSGQRAYTV